MLKKLFIFVLIIGFVGLLLGAGVATWGYFYFSRDLPKFDGINNYQPDAASLIYSEDNRLMAEVYVDRRYPVRISQVPKHVIQAFLAAEDAEFYKHPGIDLVSIARAFYKNIQEGAVRQGGSTITQQVVKNLLLSSEKKLERKIKEAILAFQIEKKLTKDQILELYLNQIFFGNTAHGIQAASKIYFHKDVSELTVAEAAILAGLPKAPSKYSPIRNVKAAKRRQKYVLAQMKKVGFISQMQADAAFHEKVNVYRAKVRKYIQGEYYATEVIKDFNKNWPDYDIRRDGLKIYAAVDLAAQNFGQVALRNGLKEVDKRRGWRGPLAELDLGTAEEEFKNQFSKSITKKLKVNRPYPALIKSISGYNLKVDLGHFTGTVNLSKTTWAKRLLKSNDRIQWVKLNSYLKSGHVIEVSLKSLPEDLDLKSDQKIELPKDILVLDQTPEVEGAVVLLNPHNGLVLATVGGYNFGRSQFNRATQSLRQPGSAFKPIVYLTAIDAFRYTASSIVYDEPRAFRVGDDVWMPGNFDSQFLGPIPLRVALEKSRNLVSADIISRIGVDPVIRYAKQMGINSSLGRNLSLSLGSSEVSPLEITRAYGIFPAGGLFFDSVFISRIEDRFGNEIYNYKQDTLKRSRQVVNEKTAFIMAHLMRGVVQSGTGWKIRELKRPAAGKTGTSNDQMDAWFVGYTPEFACGVWVGFDVKKEIGSKETGGRAAAPIWLNFMKTYLNYRDETSYKDIIDEAKLESEQLGITYEEPVEIDPADFTPPPELNSYWIHKQSGKLSEKGQTGVILEYYLPGTQPTATEGEEEINYWDLDE